MCIPHNVFGFRRASQGAMASIMRWPKGSIIHKVPKEIPPEHAVFIEPLSCAIHAVNRGQITFDDIVVVSGCGSIGLGAIAATRMKSPKMIVALDVFEWKLEIAKRCGANVVFNVRACNVVDEVKKISDGFGCDVYIEATGNPCSVTQGLEMIARHGRFVEFSVFGEKVTANFTLISDTKELSIFGGHLGPGCYPTAIRMIHQNLIPVDSIVTHKLQLDEFERAIDLVHRSAESIKVIMIPPTEGQQ